MPSPSPSLRLLGPALALSLFSLVSLPACHADGPAESPEQLQQDSRAAVDAKLRTGTWKLTSWKPDEQLEAMLQELLIRQYTSMIIRFDQGKIHADSSTMHIERAYSVVEANGPQFVVVTTDENGVQLRTSAQFSEDGRTLFFRGEIDPWRGNGALTRVAQ